MDPVSQGILGVAAAQAVSNRPWVRRAAFMGLVAGLAPDADVFIHSATDPLLSLQFHRHFTHALAFIPFGALLVALVLHPLAGRKTLRFSTTYLFCLVGYATHGLLDACTSYGTQLLWPFSDLRVAWNNISIIDPLFTVPILLLAALGIWRKSPILARCALIWAVAYLFIGVVQRDRAAAIGHELAASRGHVTDGWSAKPTFGNLLVWKIVYESEGTFYVDAVRVGLSGRYYPGASIRKLDARRDLPWLRADSQQARDVERFRWFSGDYLALSGSNTITDIRYSLVPNEIEGLWGIVLTPRAQKHQHVRYASRRAAAASKWQAFRDMLLGN
ncbi:MAG: metal-dependent hydrolase [Candidatus Tectomicrobia bacterium]|nr:metal-dependent hydrolase [Candidatus Tectomicrobia bacterium]